MGAFSLALFAAPGALATTIFVGTNLTDDAVAHTWDTFPEGLNDASPGDTVHIYPGNYTGHGTVADANLTLEGEDRNGTVLSEPSNNYATLLVNAPFLTVRNLSIGGGNRGLYTSPAPVDSSNGTVEQANFLGTSDCLTVLTGNWTVRDSLFTNCNTGILIQQRGNGTRVERVTITAADDCFTLANVRSIWVDGLWTRDCYTDPIQVLSSNDVHIAHFSVNQSVGYAYGISISRLSTPASSLENGSIFSVTRVGLTAEDAQNLRLDNVTIEDGARDGIQIGANCTNWTWRNVNVNSTRFGVDFMVPDTTERGYVPAPSDFQHDIDLTNRIRGLPIVYLRNANNLTYSGPAAMLIVVNSTGLDIQITTTIFNRPDAFLVLYTNASVFRGAASLVRDGQIVVEGSNGNRFSDFDLAYANYWFHASSRNTVEGGSWSHSTLAVRSYAPGESTQIHNHTIANITCRDTTTCFTVGWSTYDTLFFNITVVNASNGIIETDANSFAVFNSSFSELGAFAISADNQVGASGTPLFVENTTFTDAAGGVSLGRNHDRSRVFNCTFTNVSRAVVWSYSTATRTERNHFDLVGNGVEFAYGAKGEVVNNEFRNVASNVFLFDIPSGGSVLYHNNIYAAPSLVRDQGTGNLYDNGYPSAGNYWDGSNSPDQNGGSAQNSGSPDGVVDTALAVGTFKSDRYPLVDPWPPHLVLVSPANGSALVANSVIDLWTSSYFDSVKYTVNGAPLVNLAAPWDLDADALPDGNLTITIWADDVTGVADAITLYFVDNVPPAIGWISPAPGGVYPVGTVLAFSVWASSSAGWTNGSGVLPFDSPFEVDTTGWAEGVYNVTVSAADALGQASSRTFNYTIDTAAPAIAAPAWDGTSVTNGTLLPLSAADTYFDWLRWDAGGGLSSNGTSASTSIDTTGWPEGDYTIAVDAADLAGQMTHASFAITIDSIAPVLQLVSPSDGDYIQPGTLLMFSVTDANAVTVEVTRGSGAPSPATMGADLYEFSTAGWGSGTWDLHVRAFDGAGHAATLDFTVTTDGVAPDLSSVAGNFSVDEDQPLAVDGSAIDDGANPLPDENVVWAIEGSGATPEGGRNWTHTFDTPGTYTVNLTATDLAGNAATLLLTITVIDTTPPSISMAPLRVYNEGESVSFNASGTTDNGPEAGGALTLLWSFIDDGTLHTLSGATPEYTFAAPGTYTVTIRATDGRGNFNETSFTFRINDIPELGAALATSFFLPGPFEEAIEILDRDVGDDHVVSVTGHPSISVAWNGTRAFLRFAPPAAGTFRANLTIADDWSSITIALNLSAREVHAPLFTLDMPRTVVLAPGGDRTIDLSRMVHDQDGTANLSFQVSSSDNATVAALLRGGPGNYTLELTGLRPGTALVNVRVIDETGQATDFVVTVEVPSQAPAGGGMILVIVAGAAAAAAVFMLMRRKRGKSAASAPADSAVP